ncbi:MAG TPA: hypothetical protein VGH76_03725 [Actinomycetospora sp.]
MVVLAAGAGMVALTPAAFAGNMPHESSDNGGNHWSGDQGDQDHGHGHGHRGHHGSDNHRSSSSCDNDVTQMGAANGGGLLDVLGGAQTAVPVNACHILDDNNILNHVGIDVL